MPSFTREPPRRELLVVGAGPAGVAAGITARRLGLDVIVVDKARFPRDKTCGDGLTTSALRRLEQLGFDARGLPSYVRVAETVIVSPTGRHVALPLPDDGDYAAVVPRAELDAALVAHARAEGVEVREGSSVVAAHEGPESIVVGLDDGSAVEAQWVVAADGHYSPMRKLLAPTGAREASELGTWHAFRQYFDGVDDARLWVLFDAELLPGYAWVFPVGDGRANVGFGVLRDRTGRVPSGQRLAALWRALLARPALRDILGAGAEPVDSHRAWPIPASFDGSRLASGRALFAGDAASVVDPLTGEGIAQALETGALAASTIAGDASPAAVGARYRRDVRRRLGTDLRLASALQRVLGSRLGASTAIGAAALTPWTRRHFARWMFEDYPRAALLTPQRWQHGMLVRGGAYRH